MSLRAMRTLVAVADSGSLTQAAEMVSLTQAGVREHIRRLENDFGVTLFACSGHNRVMTHAGERIVGQSREILQLYDSLTLDLEGDPELVGRLRIGVEQTAIAEPLTGALAMLRWIHPGLKVSIRTGEPGEMAKQVADNELDGAISIASAHESTCGLAETALYFEGFWIVAPLDHKGLDAETILRSAPFIRFDRASVTGKAIDDELRRAGLTVHTDMELDSRNAILDMVTSGLGIGIVPLSQAGVMMLEGLKCVPFVSPQLTRSVVLLERPGQPTRRLAVALIDAIRLHAGADDS